MKVEFEIDENDPVFKGVSINQIEGQLCRLMHESYMKFLERNIKVICGSEKVIEEQGESYQKYYERCAKEDLELMLVFSTSLSKSMDEKHTAEYDARMKDRRDRGETGIQQESRLLGVSGIDYHEVRDIIEVKHNIEVRDYSNRDKIQVEMLEEIQKANPHIDHEKYLHTVPSEFTVEEKDYNDERMEVDKNLPEREDFWMWLIDKHIGYHAKDRIKPVKLDPDENTPKWVCEILKMIVEEIKDHDGYQDGIAQFYFDW